MRKQNSGKTTVLYSLYIHQGPDIKHYDLYITSENIVAIYIGEHWDKIRPKTGLGKQGDLQLYRIYKKRRRELIRKGNMTSSLNDITINLCDIREIKVKKTQDTIKIIIKTTTKTHVFNAAPKIYSHVREFVKIVKRKINEKCRR